MTALPLIIAPDPIFRAKSEAVPVVDDSVRKIMDDLLDTIHEEHGIGIAAPMVGIKKRIVVIEMMMGEGNRVKLMMANPEIIESSGEKQTVEEASLCFPGIAAPVTRPSAIKVKYLDYDGAAQELNTQGFLAQVIQHEIDYLNGKTFLDHLSLVKRDSLLRKMEKFKKHGHHHHGHVHGPNCNH